MPNPTLLCCEYCKSVVRYRLGTRYWNRMELAQQHDVKGRHELANEALREAEHYWVLGLSLGVDVRENDHD